MYINAHCATPIPLQPEIEKICKFFSTTFENQNFICKKISEEIWKQADTAYKKFTTLNEKINNLYEISKLDASINSWTSEKENITELISSYLTITINIQETLSIDNNQNKILQKRLEDSIKQTKINS